MPLYSNLSIRVQYIKHFLISGDLKVKGQFFFFLRDPVYSTVHDFTSFFFFCKSNFIDKSMQNYKYNTMHSCSSHNNINN